MKNTWIMVLLVVLAAFLLSGVPAINAIFNSNAVSSTLKAQGSSTSAAESRDEQRLNAQMFSATHNRTRWLCDLMTAAGKAQPSDSADARAVFDAARDSGIIESYSLEEIYLPLTRFFVAQTTVRALHYAQRDAVRLMDIGPTQKEMATMAYYGYFIPDESGMIYPDRAIGETEYEMLLSELRRYRLLKGRRVLSFGDSIMYGTGNNGDGIADMLAEKYGMTASDYAVPGATMGVHQGADHIRDQLARAGLNREQADIILLNGGTNDMRYQTPFGTVADGYDLTYAAEGSFTEGFEKTLWMLRQQWSGVPVVYIRVHNMDSGTDERERQYGERGLEIARKWGIDAVDLYRDTDMNTEDAAVSARYTYLSPRDGYLPDSIHPNAAGYAKYYLPLIAEAVENQFTRSKP